MSRNQPVLAKRYFVRGRVQGVGFRWFVEKSASTLGIRGWTRNLDDGRVEVYAVGTKGQLDELSGFLHRGPSASEVRGVDEAEAEVEKLSGFTIEH